MKNRVPKNSVNRRNNVQEKSSSEVKVREDRKLDNKPVMMISTSYCYENHYECERWSKKDKKYERVRRSAVIKKYNGDMRLDLADRMLCRSVP